MVAMPARPPGSHHPRITLIVRAWVEEHPSAPLRAVVTRLDPDTGRQIERRAVTSPEDVGAVVTGWLKATLAGEGSHRS